MVGSFHRKFRLAGLIALMIGACITAYPQPVAGINSKPVLTLENLNTSDWPGISTVRLSDDGNYVYYSVSNKPLPGKSQYFIEATRKDWKQELINARNAVFTSDSKWLIWKEVKDSVVLLEITKNKTLHLSGVQDYQLVDIGGQSWIAYRTADNPTTLLLQQPGKAALRKYENVERFQFSPMRLKLLLESNGSCGTVVRWVDLVNGKTATIWENGHGKPGNYVFNDAENQLIFFAASKQNDQTIYSLYRFGDGDAKPALLMDDRSVGIAAGSRIAPSGLKFSKNENYILFDLLASTEGESDAANKGVDIWSYQDVQLMSAQLNDRKSKRQSYAVALDPATKAIVRIEQEHERLLGLASDYALVKYEPYNGWSEEAYWNTAARASFTLVSLKDGSRKIIKTGVIDGFDQVGISPSEKWLNWFDETAGAYKSFEIATGTVHTITDASTSWVMAEDDHSGVTPTWPTGLPTWLAQDEAVLIYDNYDIWLVDPSGKKKPQNLTNGLGAREQIKFTLANIGADLQAASVARKSKLLLRATDTQNQDRGFYRLTLGKNGDPEKLVMGPWIFGSWENFGGYAEYVEPPVKARNAEMYLTIRQSASERFNYFVTSDFKQLKFLSNDQPQQAFNWLRSELVHFPMPDGSKRAGILYKPDNFDSTQRYPVIFNYYERRSDELNLFIYPQPSFANINIPLFVSSGYLVFVPDMVYRIGEPGESAVETVEAAVEYLSRLSYVDHAHMGIQGHSWGGYQTGYIVTRSHRFKAACAAAGIYDRISYYGSDLRGSYTRFHSERDQGRMGGTPWEKKTEYLRSSPVLQADQVTTPLLLMGSEGDSNVDFRQSIEYFTMLRRLGKKVWLLQYDGGNHILGYGSEDAKDFHTRLLQFFDHYLKGKPAPVWMTRGIPASGKGMDNGLQFDTDIKTPGPGLTQTTDLK